MALDTKGTAHVFGIAAGTTAIANATVQAFSIGGNHQNKSNTLNELGNEIERRRDDTIQEGSITLRFESGYTPDSAADTITYNSVEYEIDSVDRTESNGAHTEITYNIKKTEYVTYT